MPLQKQKTKKNLFSPSKYYAGLSDTQKKKRRAEIKKFSKKNWKNSGAYVGFKTDKAIKTKKSQYTKEWRLLFPEAKSLKQKANATGVPLPYIRKSFNRGMAAWRTGHRPGATQQQWGYARVHSFLMCGKTYQTADSDLAKKAKETSSSARKWWAKTCTSSYET